VIITCCNYQTIHYLAVFFHFFSMNCNLGYIGIICVLGARPMAYSPKYSILWEAAFYCLIIVLHIFTYIGSSRQMINRIT
jgi:hypothetical protein